MPHPDGAIGLYLNEEGKKWQLIDFIHDRNQQKWIIDELVKRGYSIEIYYSKRGMEVRIWGDDSYLEFCEEKEKLDDSNLISAVEQLIDKEK